MTRYSIHCINMEKSSFRWVIFPHMRMFPTLQLNAGTLSWNNIVTQSQSLFLKRTITTKTNSDFYKLTNTSVLVHNFFLFPWQANKRWLHMEAKFQTKLMTKLFFWSIFDGIFESIFDGWQKLSKYTSYLHAHRKFLISVNMGKGCATCKGSPFLMQL